MGSKNFTESQVLGELYAQLFTAHGYHVQLKPDLGSAELMNRLLKAGQINAYPEYVGILVSAVANNQTVFQSVAQVVAAAQKLEASQGAVFMTPVTPFEDTGEYIVTKSLRRHTASRRLPTSRSSGRPTSSCTPPT